MEQVVGEFTRKVIFRPGYDKRNAGYGLHNLEIVFVLIGPLGAVDFCVHKTWFYTKTAREHLLKWGIHPFDSPYDKSPWLASINYFVGRDNPCYFDGMNSGAPEVLMEEFVAKGESVVWEELERWYRIWFVEAKPEDDEGENV